MLKVLLGLFVNWVIHFLKTYNPWHIKTSWMRKWSCPPEIHTELVSSITHCLYRDAYIIRGKYFRFHEEQILLFSKKRSQSRMYYQRSRDIENIPPTQAALHLYKLYTIYQAGYVSLHQIFQVHHFGNGSRRTEYRNRSGHFSCMLYP